MDRTWGEGEGVVTELRFIKDAVKTYFWCFVCVAGGRQGTQTLKLKMVSERLEAKITSEGLCDAGIWLTVSACL